MENNFQLTALLFHTEGLRYTPAGAAVLDIVLKHESTQYENGVACKINFQLPARIIGPNAQLWQHQQGKIVTVKGFLAQQSQRISRPMLRIQSIQEYKG